MSDELLEALEKIFATDSELYQERGFQRRIGFGTRPALINIDLANAWTRPGNPFSCLNMVVIITSKSILMQPSDIYSMNPSQMLHGWVLASLTNLDHRLIILMKMSTITGW